MQLMKLHKIYIISNKLILTLIFSSKRESFALENMYL